MSSLSNSRKNRINDTGRLNAGKASVESLKFVRKPLVIDAAEVEHRGMQVAEVDNVLDRTVPEFIG